MTSLFRQLGLDILKPETNFGNETSLSFIPVCLYASQYVQYNVNFSVFLHISNKFHSSLLFLCITG